eukprot:TRINITY_DN795_c0_g2_i2.p2 TRINITY_DN795_c0_g2~~TRINITY_DN795_c0_g2_i2.p2  ORF type:complete len:167 (+),score=73.75 TRINITY_DN795_c0_g2_i2:607-1107(+)
MRVRFDDDDEYRNSDDDSDQEYDSEMDDDMSSSDDNDSVSSFLLGNKKDTDILREQLPLELFDDRTFETRSPQEWVELGQDIGGTAAWSRYFAVDGKAKWAACRVIEYSDEQEAYLVEWKETRKRKFVKRLNLRFDVESQTQFEERRNHAVTSRQEAEAHLVRLSH